MFVLVECGHSHMAFVEPCLPMWFMVYTCYHLQRNLPPATGSGSSTKTNGVGWAAFWWSEHLLIIIALHLIVFLFLGEKKVRKENVRKQRKHKVPNTSDMENCYPAMYFLLSYHQCSFLLPALCQLKIWTFHVYIIEGCVLSISIAICSVYLFLVGG